MVVVAYNAEVDRGMGCSTQLDHNPGSHCIDGLGEDVHANLGFGVAKCDNV